ncbi:MAG: thioredoxin family protein [Parafilimonas sp.]
MKFILSIIIASFSFTSCHVSSTAKEKPVVKNNEIKKTGIDFIEDDWAQALKAAKDQNKLVFVDIYATWCGPCKMLKQYTFSDSLVSDFFNKNFINVSIDGEKGVGPMLAQQYSIQGYPSLIVADSTGKPVLVTAGYMPATVLMQFGNEALKKGGHAKM